MAGGRGMNRSLFFVLILSISIPIAAQQYTTTEIGRMTTGNNVNLVVSVDSSRTLILTTPAHSIYIDVQMAPAFRNTLEAVLVGMKELDAKGITVVDHHTIGKLTFAGDRDISLDGIVFRMELNTNRADRVLLLMYSSRVMEDLLFTTAQLAQFNDLVNKGLKSVADFSDQFVFIQSTINKIYDTGFK
jgi:hypothetical protein